MIITCKNIETSVVTIKSFKNFLQISKKINKQCKSIPLKKELKGILTANYETFYVVGWWEVGFTRRRSAFNLRNLIYVLQQIKRWQAKIKNSWTVIWTIFTISTLPKSIKMTFMERVHLWTCKLGLFVWKLGRYYKLYEKTAAIFFEVCKGTTISGY